MEIKSLIKKMKDINPALIDFIDSDVDCEAKFKTLIQIIEKQAIFQNQEEIRTLFQLISIIADNHHRTFDFFDKLEKIFQYLIKDTPLPISYYIPDYKKYNKRILFLLLENNLLKPDEAFLNEYLKNIPGNFPFSTKNFNQFQSYYYLYPVIKANLDEKIQKTIEKEIHEYFNIDDISIFSTNCQIGENETNICSLIRSDSIEEFVIYVNRTNFSLSTKIKPTIYETHSFLTDKEPTLIEYASFFGSVQIFQYLKNNKVPLTFSLWSYGVHSNNAELIQILEENISNKETKKSYEEALLESIKCHHNDISNYIKENLYETNQENDENQFYYNLNDTISKSLNFYFISCEIETMICDPKKEKIFKLYQLCFSLTTITIPSSITTIGDCAFYKCSSLTTINIPSSITSIGACAFYECSSLTAITIPSSITTIGEGTFYGCSSLTTITIPSSITTIGDGAFYGCSSLATITIPSSVTSIGKSAFLGCSKLTQITIPSSVTLIRNDENIDDDIHSEEMNFVEELGDIIHLDDTTVYMADLPLEKNSYPPSCAIDEDFLNQIFRNNNIYPNSVTIKTKIRRNCTAYAFAYIKFSTHEEAVRAIDAMNYTKFDNVPIRLITIDEVYNNNILNSNENCIIIKNIDRSLEVFQIHDAFSNFGNIISCKMPIDFDHQTQQYLSRGYCFLCFQNAKNAKQVIIDLKNEEINGKPFEIESVSSKVNGINCEGLFSGCSSLTQIKIPSSMTSIGNYDFSGCSSLTQITIPSSVTTIGYYAFSQCKSLTQITIPSSVTSIGDSAFSECSSLIQITIPSSVTSIGDHAFYKCSSLKQITIPSSVTSIGDHLFYECTSLNQILLPSSIASIKYDAFGKCLSLKQITIPSSVKSIGESAFRECSSLTQITFEIPSSVTSFGRWTFYKCSSLIEITIPSSVTFIEHDMFYECSSLAQITFENPSSVTSIGSYAFCGCSSLTQITIPSSVTEIYCDAFLGCRSLTQITIPSSLSTENIGLISRVEILRI